MTIINAPSGAQHARILSVGAYRPTRVVSNEEICQHIDSSDEWIRSRSGIASRRWAGPEETLLDMAVTAGAKALAEAGIEASDLGCVLVSTVTHMRQTPSLATAVASTLGTTTAAAFDISAGCAGFCYGVSLASDMVRGGSARYVLLVAAERLSDMTDLTDRSTAFLFGDGAGAVVIGPSETPGIGATAWGADGSQYDAIGQTFAWDQLRQDPGLGWPFLRMAGQQVFRWASFEMVPVARRALEQAGITADQLDAFIPHQANMRITDTMIKALKLPSHVVVARDIEEQGNTSAASIPLAMERLLSTHEGLRGGTALLIGFGSGLAYAAQVVTLP
jgi:3-oxoacyl-[acyl-carrier-protein] synthase-3